ncbi:putative T7SS-secreted protein [Streptomyces sp. NPDC002574]|uniref:putative T7SS-secreted protein n=1 Tax=Streptomyces sp. NPDC002574 TaxID=3364652 RepID=UPI00369BAF70
MTVAEYPSIGFDPAPGKLESVDDLNTKLTRAATGLDNAYTTLNGITHGGKTWEGEAASAFAEKVGDLPKYVGDSRDALREAATQLASWRARLAEYQQKAREYEAEARAAKEREKTGQGAYDRATSAYNQAASDPALRLAGQYYATQSELADAQARIDAASGRLDRAGRELDTAGKELQKAQDELDGIIKRAEELLEHHQSDARGIADRLRKANDNAPDTGFFEGLSDALTKLGHSIQNWCVKHADLLKKIGDILSAVSGVLAVASLLTMWCPPLSGALALAGGVTALGALGAHGAAKLGGADVSWTSIGMDALAAVPGGKFLAIGATGKIGKAFNAVKADAAITGGLKFTLTGRLPVQGASKLANLMKDSSMLSFARTPLSKVASTLDNLPMKPQEWWYRGSWTGITGTGTGLKIPGLFADEPPAAGA